MTEKILNMTKEELIIAMEEIDEMMNELKELYKPYVGRRLDSISMDELENLSKIASRLQHLVNAKSDIRSIAISKYGIFVM